MTNQPTVHIVGASREKVCGCGCGSGRSCGFDSESGSRCGFFGASVQSCKNLVSVVALLQGNFEKSHDFKANFEEKCAVLMQLQNLMTTSCH